MFAGFRKLDNLCVIVDNNNLQIDGPIDEVCSPYPIDKKFESFNFHVINIDGNDFDEIKRAFDEARATKGMPTAIIAHTVKGKGVSYTTRNMQWRWRILERQVKHCVRSKDCNERELRQCFGRAWRRA